jgi:3-methyladenine DNA glycosylase AlkC
MGKVDDYRETLRGLEDWEPFLLRESGLPGPRGNIELAYAVAEEGDQELFKHLLSFEPKQAPVNSPHEFLAFCGVLGLGKLLSQGQVEVLEALRFHASDPRWRIREAVAKALQYLGEVDMDALLHEMEAWSEGNRLEQRAAAAALCEPRLLREPEQVESVLQILDRITALLQDAEDRRADEFQALRKGLGYCWSVAVAAYPEAGKQAMERWFATDDRDVLWIMKQNLRKKRLEREDAAWVTRWREQLG